MKIRRHSGEIFSIFALIPVSEVEELQALSPSLVLTATGQK